MNIGLKNTVAKWVLILLFWGLGNLGAWGENLSWNGGAITAHILSIAAPDHASGKTACARFDLQPYRGKELSFSIRCRAQEVTKPLHPWNGVKFMLSYQVNGKTFYPGAPGSYGSYDWQLLTFNATIPESADVGTLTLGLQESSGKVEYDLNTLQIKPWQNKAYVPYRIKYPAAIAALPRLRGVMSPAGGLTENDFRTLKQWRVNLVRYQLTPQGQSDFATDLAAYDRWLEGRLAALDQNMQEGYERYGILFVVDLHLVPGGRDQANVLRMLDDSRYADHFIAVWRKLAAKFKNHPAVWAYDLVNEPVQGGAAHRYTASELQFKAAQAIRQIDPTTPIIIEPADWATPAVFAGLEPLPLDNLIYEVHMYDPPAYTHQGVDHRPTGQPYPGYYGGKLYDPAALRTVLQPVREFQERYGAKIYVGEFSASVWAPDGGAYLRDCLKIFEEYDWDWTYHAFREWEGWSLEHEVDAAGKIVPAPESLRKNIVLDIWKRNRVAQ